jgi:MraZ protein
MFFGRFEHSLDPKGRIILPSRFRQTFDSQAFLSQHYERCLALWTPAGFDEQLAARKETQDRSRTDRNRARFWASGVVDVEIDRQGRLAIPQYLREYAHLDGAVLITGAIDHIEIWNPAVYAEKVDSAEADFADDSPEPDSAEPEATD